MEQQLARAQRKVDALERRAIELQDQIAQLEVVREAVRSEIIRLPKGGVLVRAEDARSPFKIPVRRDDGDDAAGGPVAR
jgi:hypothetical protein